MGAVGATGADGLSAGRALGAKVEAVCEEGAEAEAVCDSRRALSAGAATPACRRYFPLARTIGLEDVVVRLGNEARPAAAAALEPVTSQCERGHHEDQSDQNKNELANHATSIQRKPKTGERKSTPGRRSIRFRFVFRFVA